MKKIELEKVDNYSYNLLAPNGKRFGTLQMQDDGYFTFDGMDAWVLREIADRIDELDLPLVENTKEYFEKNK